MQKKNDIKVFCPVFMGVSAICLFADTNEYCFY